MSKYNFGGDGGRGGAGMPGFTASDANMREDELERLRKLNSEMEKTLMYVCHNICPETERKECPDGYNAKCPVLEIFNRMGGARGMRENPILAWYSKEELYKKIVKLESDNQMLLFALQEAVEIEPSLLACGMIANALDKAKGVQGN